MGLIAAFSMTFSLQRDLEDLNNRRPAYLSRLLVYFLPSPTPAPVCTQVLKLPCLGPNRSLP